MRSIHAHPTHTCSALQLPVVLPVGRHVCPGPSNGTMQLLVAPAAAACGSWLLTVDHFSPGPPRSKPRTPQEAAWRHPRALVRTMPLMSIPRQRPRDLPPRSSPDQIPQGKTLSRPLRPQRSQQQSESSVTA